MLWPIKNTEIVVEGGILFSTLHIHTNDAPIMQKPTRKIPTTCEVSNVVDVGRISKTGGGAIVGNKWTPP